MIDKVPKLSIFIPSVIGICLIGLAIWGFFALRVSPEIGPEIGNSAPGFTLQTVAGESVALSEFRGKMVMLSYWGPVDDFWHNEKLAQEAYSIQTIRAKWSDKELAILGINVRADRTRVQDFITRYGLTFPVLLDSEGEVSTGYDVVCYPMHFFIDGKGIVKLVLHGYFRSYDEIESILNNIKSEETISNAAPAIYDILISSVTDKSVTITWITEEPATSDVMLYEIQEDGAILRMSVQPDEALVTNHHVIVDGLASDTTYHFRVLSGYNLESQSLSEKHSFFTLSDTTPPVNTEVNTSNITESSITITWITDEPATTRVEYGISDDYLSDMIMGRELNTRHSISLDELKPDTDYYFRVKSEDASGNEATSDVGTVTTLPALPVGTEIGNLAPDFTLQTIGGEYITLSDLRGRIVMVKFWISGCNACIREIPHTHAIFDRWSKEELVLLAVNIRENAETVQKFIDRWGLTSTVLLDSEGAVDEIYQPAFFPTTFFIDPQGVIKDVKEGRFSSEYEIERILNAF